MPLYPNLESVKSLESNDSINFNLKKTLENKKDSTKLYYYSDENNDSVKSKVKFVCLKDFPENFKLSKYDYNQFLDEKRKGNKISIAIAVKENIQNTLFDLLVDTIKKHVSLSNDLKTMNKEKEIKISEFLRVNTKKIESFKNFEEIYDKTTGDNLEGKKESLEKTFKALEEDYKNFQGLNLYETEELEPLLIKAKKTYEDGLSLLKPYDPDAFEEKVKRLTACHDEFKTKIDRIEAVAKLKELIDNVNALMERLHDFKSKINVLQSEEHKDIITGINALSNVVNKKENVYDKDFILGLESQYNELNKEFTNLKQNLFGNKENKSAESVSEEIPALKRLVSALDDQHKKLNDYPPSKEGKKKIKEQLIQKISEIITQKDNNFFYTNVKNAINFIEDNIEEAGKYTGWHPSKFGTISDLGQLFQETSVLLNEILSKLSENHTNDTSNAPSMALGRA